jgi:DNA-directed RNA polymerase subunit F
MVRKVLDEKPITLGQVHELLKIREETGINYVQRVTAQHAEKLSRGAAFSEEVIQALRKEFDLPRILVVQILNINPKTPIDVRAITSDRLSDDQIEQLLTRYSEFVTIAATATTETDETSDEEKDEDEEEFEDL